MRDDGGAQGCGEAPWLPLPAHVLRRAFWEQPQLNGLVDGEEQWLSPSSWTSSLLWATWGCLGSRKVPVIMETLWICEAVLNWTYVKVFS